MILPITAYGSTILRKQAEEITETYPNLKELISDMFDTMYNAYGVGLAAPQIGKSIRLFVVDTSGFVKKGVQDDDLLNFKKVFINPIIEEESGNNWLFNEGCLSIPDINEDVARKETIVLSYYDENFNFFRETFNGKKARVIQHEYDHIEGKLFVDHLSLIKKRQLQNRLEAINQGKIHTDYKMKFASVLKKRR